MPSYNYGLQSSVRICAPKPEKLFAFTSPGITGTYTRQNLLYWSGRGKTSAAEDTALHLVTPNRYTLGLRLLTGTMRLALPMVELVQRHHKHFGILLGLIVFLGKGTDALVTVLWSHPDEVLICDNGKGEDILRRAIKPQTGNSAGTLYFRVLVNPISDTAGN